MAERCFWTKSARCRPPPKRRFCAPYRIKKLQRRCLRPRSASAAGPNSSPPRHRRSLQLEAAERHFREDLYFRLAMVEIKLPPVIDRKEDFPLLIREFVIRFGVQYRKEIEGITRKAESILLRYPWPGNIREMENAIDYACMICDSARIDVNHLPEKLLRPVAARTPEVLHPLVSLDEIDRRHARAVLEQLAGNKVEAASVLGVSRATLYRLLAGQKES